MMTKQKAYAYILNGPRLLVFEQPEFPEAGIQVPGGTIESGETPAQAVMREAAEETGLLNLDLVDLLGEADFDLTAFGKAEIHHRYFYQLTCPQAPATWSHGEFNPSEGEEQAIIYNFYWVQWPENRPDLIAGQGQLLDKLVI